MDGYKLPFVLQYNKGMCFNFLSLHFLIRVKSSSDLIGFEIRYIIFFAHIQSRDLSCVLANIFSEKKVKKYFILKHLIHYGGKITLFLLEFILCFNLVVTFSCCKEYFSSWSLEFNDFTGRKES